MKGSTQAIPTYLYIIIALAIGIIMLLMISKYSRVFIEEEENIKISGNKEEISEVLTKLIYECWQDNRMGLNDESTVCKEVEFEENLKINEKDLNEFLSCDKLPNNNCYPDLCDCSSDYFDDNDKIFWFAEPENTELKISYSGQLRKIFIVGFPCDPICMCINECKEFCFNNEKVCRETNYFSECKSDCHQETTTTTNPGKCYAHFSGVHISGKKVEIYYEYFFRTKVFEDDKWSEIIPNGEYSSIKLAFPILKNTTFDGIAIKSGTHLVIYEKEDFEGRVVLDIKGPAIINNIGFKQDEYGYKNDEKYKDVFDDVNWPDEELAKEFPPEVRKWSDEIMHNWVDGSCKITCE